MKSSKASASKVGGATKGKDENREMHTWVTGIRSGEYVTGIVKTIDNNNLNTTFRMDFPEGKLFPPFRKKGDFNDLALRDNAQGYLGTLSVAEREAWIEDHRVDEEMYISDMDDALLTFVSIGGVFLKLKEEDQARLMSGVPVSMKEVYNMFPRKIGSNAARHTLIFRGSIWKVIDLPSETIKPTVYYDLLTQQYSETQTHPRVCLIHINETTTIGLCDDPPGAPIDVNTSISEYFSWFTPGILKSLIQKCIRFYPEHILVDEDRGIALPTEDVVETAYLMLFNNPGSFVPDLNAFVTGSESALKRLAVCLVEDSFHKHSVISALLFAALAARKRFVFSTAFMQLTCQWAKEALNDSCFQELEGDTYKVDRGQYISGALEALGSFESDKKLFQNYSRGRLRRKKEMGREYVRPSMVHIAHCFDQHCTTDVVHCMDQHLIKQKVGSFLDIKDLFQLMWTQASSLNPRRIKATNNKPIKPKKFITDAQIRYWRWKKTCFVRDLSHQHHQNVFVPTTGITGSVHLRKLIDESWISGILGPIKQNIDGKNVLSFYHPENIGSIVTIRAPSRQPNLPELTDEQLALAELELKKRMKAPCTIKEPCIGVDGAITISDEAILYRDHTTRTITPWKDFCNGLIAVPIFQHASTTLDTTSGASAGPEVVSFDTYWNFCLQYGQVQDVEGNGIICDDWQAQLTRELELIPDIRFLLRVAMYLRAVTDEIRLYQISRDGTGTYQEVNMYDMHVFRFLCACCYYVPGALRLKKSHGLSISFDVINMAIWNNVRHFVFGKTLNVSSDHASGWERRIERIYEYRRLPYTTDWKIADLDPRLMKPYQAEAVERILLRSQFGKRGNIMWIPVGAGKTFIVINTLFRMIQRQSLPTYVVFALPASALESVRAEFEKSGWPTVFLDFTKQTNRTTGVVTYSQHFKLQQYKINFIVHDRMKEEGMHQQLLENAADIFLILDEFHLMIDLGTQRTSTALELSKVCNNFIAMTGTLVKDKDPEGLIAWLSQVVDFQLTSNNYMVGVAALISNKFNHGIEERRLFIDADMTSSERQAYHSVVDRKLGGSVERTNFREAVRICYSITEREIVRLAIERLQKGQRYRQQKGNPGRGVKRNHEGEEIASSVMSESAGVMGATEESSTAIKREISGHHDQGQLDEDQEGDDIVFVVALDIRMQERMEQAFQQHGYRTFCISSSQQIHLTADMKTDIQVVITTMKHSTGYTLTKIKTMFQGVYFSNQATRTQLVGRLIRMGQPSKHVNIVTVHTGILSYTLKNYEDSRSLEKVLSDLAKDI